MAGVVKHRLNKKERGKSALGALGFANVLKGQKTAQRHFSVLEEVKT